LLGKWKNFDELESSLSIDELMAMIEALRKREERERIFSAAINGVDLEDNSNGGDVTDLQKGQTAQEEGFGINEGLGFMQMEV
jgi:hypothetical protein